MRTPLIDQCQTVAGDIEATLRDTVPQLVQSRDARTFHFQFVIQIRDGYLQGTDVETHDDTFDNHSGDSPELPNGKPHGEAIRELSTWLVRDLRQRAIKGYHGTVTIRVWVRKDQLAFSTKVRRQRRYTW